MTSPISRPAIFASAFAPHIGGVEELTRQLALEQTRRGMRPRVVTMRWPKTLAQSETVDGVEVSRHVFRVPEPRVRFLAGWAATSWLVHRQVNADLARHGSDLIHVECVAGNARYALQAARHRNVPLVVSMQGELTMDATDLYARSAQQRRAWRALLDAAHAVTGCSQSVLDDAAAMYPGAWQDRASVVPNGVRLRDFASTPLLEHPRPYVLGIGRLVPQKGFEDLIRAFAILGSDSNLDLIIAGDGPNRLALEDLAKALDLSHRVTFVGPLDRQRAAAAFRGAATFVLPSRLEPQGIVVLEAMAAGTPVVATTVGGVAETVTDETNGLMVDPGAPEQLARAIERLRQDDQLRQRLVLNGFETAANRDWEKITDLYERVYRCAADLKRDR